MTNFEKIKTLNIVEMAWVFENIHEEFISSPDPIGGGLMCYGFLSLVKWLQQEYNSYDDIWINIRKTQTMEEAIALLKEVVKHDSEYLKATITQELRDRIKKFVEGCE